MAVPDPTTPTTPPTASAVTPSAPLDPARQRVVDFLAGFSLETAPGVAEKTASFAALMPAGTKVYVAYVPGTDLGEVVTTVARLAREGLAPVPHVPARTLTGPDQLDDFLARCAGEGGVEQVLCIGGDRAVPLGSFDSTMQMLETGLFDKHGIRRIGVAGHPEGYKPIGDAGILAALKEKNAFAERTGAELHIVTQFCFDPEAVIAWDKRLRLLGNRLPIHIGIAGPAKLKSLLHYATMCGIGNSARMLKRQAFNLTKLASVSAPDALIAALAKYRAEDPECGITQTHFFTFGGLKRATRWIEGVLQGDFAMTADATGFTVQRDLD